jgi:hypothetical protein
MQQINLINADQAQVRQISLDSVHASFRPLADETYDVVLDISSHKFLISIKERAGQIESFEIVLAKTFVQLTQKIVLTLKKLVQYLWNKVR